MQSSLQVKRGGALRWSLESDYGWLFAGEGLQKKIRRSRAKEVVADHRETQLTGLIMGKRCGCHIGNCKEEAKCVREEKP